MEKILVVDDEQGLRDVLSIMLKRAGYAVTVASDGDEAIAQVQKEIFDLVITDLKMPRVGGLEVLKAVKAASPDTVVLMITAFASVETAISAACPARAARCRSTALWHTLVRPPTNQRANGGLL